MGLTGEQARAVERSGQDVCVTAGPGSGKTRVLVERFAWLVESGVQPLRILAFTFTEKAAGEIKQRLVKRFRGQPEIRTEIERAWVATIHGFCARLLRENAIAAGLDPRFAIEDEGPAAVDASEMARQTLEELYREQPDAMRGLLEGLASTDAADSLHDLYDAVRGAGADIGSLVVFDPREAEPAAREFGELVAVMLAPPPGDWTPQQKEYLAGRQEWARGAQAAAAERNWIGCLEALARLDCDRRKLKKASAINEAFRRLKDERLKPYRATFAAACYRPQYALLLEALRRLHVRFRDAKRAASVTDFADLEELAIALLERSEQVRRETQESFDAILMDELQDTNPLQWRLAGLVRRPKNFFAVGDINQSIFRFRHAVPNLFLEFRRSLEESGHEVDRLARNHRSRPEILDAVNRVLNGAVGIEEFRFEAGGEFTTKTQPSVEVIVGSGEDSEQASEIEARWVARRIRELEGAVVIGKPEEARPARLSDMAVLVRKVKALEPFLKAFTEFGIPYVLTKGRGFYQQREVLDLANWIKVLANPRDEISLAAVLRSPLVGVSDETLLRLKTVGRLDAALGEAERAEGLAEDDLERLIWFRGHLAAARAVADDVSPDLLLARALDQSGYLDGLPAAARANVEKLLATLRQSWLGRPRPLAELAQELIDLRASQPEPDAPPAEAADAVQVLTMHGAKGLEFPIVFVAALHSGVSQNQPPLAYAPGFGVGVRWRDPASADCAEDPMLGAIARNERLRDAEEASRLLYVAMTRAEEHLVLSFARTKRPRSSYPALVEAGFGLDLSVFDNRWIDLGSVRLLRAGGPPEPWEDGGRVAAGSREQELEPPEVADQHDYAAAVTSVALFGKCPRRYFLNRYLGWEEAGTHVQSTDREEIEDAPTDASEFGRQVHALLAGEPVDNPGAEALELARRFRESELGRRAARATRAEREFDFMLALDDLVLHGQIDLWFEEGGELLLVDYKTDRHEDRADSYALQLRLYALAIERIAGRLPDRALLCYLRSGRAIEVDLGGVSLQAAREYVQAFREAQSSLEFPMQAGDQCRSCGFSGGLCRE